MFTRAATALALATALTTVAAPAFADRPSATAKAAASVENREPVGESARFRHGERVYVWSQIEHATGDDVEHVWKRDGRELRRARFEVGSSRWRVSSRLTSAPPGSYDVDVTAGGEILTTVHFTVE
jgi:hypothetical protein